MRHDPAGASIVIMLRSLKLDLSPFLAAPCVRLSHLPFEGDRTFPAQC
jgi:hypothetical protein